MVSYYIDTYPFNRWLTQWGVRLESEAKQRKRAKSLLPLDILAENAMFTFNRTGGGVEIRSATYVRVPDLCKLVLWLLDSNERYLVVMMFRSIQCLHCVSNHCSCNRLTWHDGLIPEDEIWVKIGGDKGGGSFKMSLQLANILHPNSTNNTFVFSCFEADDSLTNLHVALDTYKAEVDSLMSLTWQ